MKVAICDVYCCQDRVWWYALVSDTEETRTMLSSMQNKDMGNDILTIEEQRLYSQIVNIRKLVDKSELIIGEEPEPTIDYSKYDYVLTNVIC